MARRNGELNSRGIDKGWPHQIALRAEATHGERYVSARLVLRGSIPLPARSLHRWHRWLLERRCFAVRADAEKFRAQFGGEFLDPKDRPKWPGK